MSLLDLFLLLCILIVSAYTYTKRNVMIIETYRGRTNTRVVSKTEKRLKALESIVGTHTRAISAIQHSVNYLTNIIGFKETENKKFKNRKFKNRKSKNRKSLFQRIIDMEKELNEEDKGADEYEYQLPK